jgi:hypothetical protein
MLLEQTYGALSETLGSSDADDGEDSEGLHLDGR